jgi:hypothetical protein
MAPVLSRLAGNRMLRDRREFDPSAIGDVKRTLAQATLGTPVRKWSTPIRQANKQIFASAAGFDC